MPLFPRGSVTASWGPCIRLRLHQAHTSALQLRFYQREGLQVRARGRAALGLGARTPAKAALALAQHQLPIVHTISTNERKARVRGCLCAELIVACWPLQNREPASMPAPSPHRTE